MTSLLLALIHFYQRWISPMTGAACRFEPSCSRYASLCLHYHGPGRGGWLTLKRLLRCNPLFAPGIDLPPLPPHAPAHAREPDWARLSQLYSLSDSEPAPPAPSIPPQKAPDRE